MATIVHDIPVAVAPPRTREYRGVWSWVTTVDHKRIGILYGATAFAFFLIGGLEALLIRMQLAVPNNTLINPETYNQLFTMHGTTMIFLVVMPLSVAFFNVVVPLQIGARDVAFPRLNALSYWIFLTGGIFLNLSWLMGHAPNMGWFAYANLTEHTYNPGLGPDFWALGLLVLGTASMAGAFNFVVTIINMRAPGMSLMRMPVFTWMTFVVSFLIIFAFPIITVALIELVFDRHFGTNFFNADASIRGDTLLWQHLFWLFGHPEVYILILPALGVVSEVLPVFSRKPLFGYAVVVYSGIAIGFVSFGVWAHHMFTTGLGPVANAVFLTTTLAVAVPTGVKIFNWIATLWGGSIRFSVAMMYSIAFVSLFTIGGLSGVSHAIVPSDWQQQDTYYIVAHFHYVLFGGAIMGLFSGLYYWWPKITGRLLNEKVGTLQFWLMFLGFNITFGPMHFLGMDGMPRRIFTYPAGMGWELWNMVATAGAFMMGLGVLLFVHNAVTSLRRGERASGDPWDARTLEWSIPSPPPVYNFATIPLVHGRDALWAVKHPHRAEREGELETTHIDVQLAGRQIGDVDTPDEGSHGNPDAYDDVHAHGIHIPDGSWFPVITAFGLTFFAAGLIFGWWLTVLGGLMLIFGIYAWSYEPING